MAIYSNIFPLNSLLIYNKLNMFKYTTWYILEYVYSVKPSPLSGDERKHRPQETSSCPFRITHGDLTPVSRQPRICFLLLLISMHFLEFHMDVYSTCLSLFIHRNYFEICPCCCLLVFHFMDVAQFIYSFPYSCVQFGAIQIEQQ